jgi:hypothetical protein
MPGGLKLRAAIKIGFREVTTEADYETRPGDKYMDVKGLLKPCGFFVAIGKKPWTRFYSMRENWIRYVKEKKIKERKPEARPIVRLYKGGKNAEGEKN